MKKLICVLLALLCCAALTTTAFADVILPPAWAGNGNTDDPGAIEIIPVDGLAADQTDPAAAPAATEAPAAEPAGANNPAILYLGIGVAAAAAALALFLLLRKKPK